MITKRDKREDGKFKKTYPEGVTEAGALRAAREQWRITFRWTESGPAEVKIVDYH